MEEAPAGSCFDLEGSWRVLEGPGGSRQFKLAGSACINCCWRLPNDVFTSLWSLEGPEGSWRVLNQ